MTGQPYRPASGAEGRAFEASWCERCAHGRAFRDWAAADGPQDEQPGGCPILVAAVAHEADDPAYPPEWRLSAAGPPECRGYRALDDARCPGTLDLFAGPQPREEASRRRGPSPPT